MASRKNEVVALDSETQGVFLRFSRSKSQDDAPILADCTYRTPESVKPLEEVVDRINQFIGQSGIRDSEHASRLVEEQQRIDRVNHLRPPGLLRVLSAPLGERRNPAACCFWEAIVAHGTNGGFQMLSQQRGGKLTLALFQLDCRRGEL